MTREPTGDGCAARTPAADDDDVRGRRLEVDLLLRDLVVVGVVGLAAWTLAAAAGLITHSISIAPVPTLRFGLAISVLVCSRRAYRGARGWRRRREPADARLGFSRRISADRDRTDAPGPA